MLFLLVLLCLNLKQVQNDGTSRPDQEVNFLHINSHILSRFAITVFSSRVTNLENRSKEIYFHTVIPEEAFITNFSMFINDKIIYGNIQEKEKAKETYTKAVQKGQSAGLVAEKPRETNSFQISVNVAAMESVVFNLTYQEILKRVHGLYKHVINIETDQQVKDMKINVFITEQGKIKAIKVPKFGPKIGEKTNLELFNITQEEKAKIDVTVFENITQALVTYDGDKTNNATTGQLVLLYDMERDNSGGSVQVFDGYFVHFFAPNGLVKGKKHIVFVLDQSGSMYGRKFEQTQVAMKRIINELDEGDRLNILMFNDKLTLWKAESVKATKETKEEAIRFVTDAKASMTTNIFDALKKTLELMSLESSDQYSPMILFMTDGEATDGITNNDVIVQKITEINRGLNRRITVHSLAFGRSADYNLVQRLSKHNRGLAKKIYEDADADLQLTGFYAEISSPLLSEVQFEYLNGSVDVSTLARSGEYNYYEGGELVVIGKLATGDKESGEGATSTTTQSPEVINPLFDVHIRAQAAAVGPESKKSDVQNPGQLLFIARSSPLYCSRGIVWWNRPPCCLRPDCWFPPIGQPKPPVEDPIAGSTTFSGFIERMWAYLTVKKLLKEYNLEPKDNDTRKAEALRLSLKYKFVTPLTSMVVVQPDLNQSLNLLSEMPPKQSPSAYRQYHAFARSGHYVMGLAGQPGSSFARYGGGGVFRKAAASGPSIQIDAEMYSLPATMTTDVQHTPVLIYHEEPVIAYLDVTDPIDDESSRKNMAFLDSLNRCAETKRRKVLIVLRYLRVTSEFNVTVSDEPPPNTTALYNRAKEFTAEQEASFQNQVTLNVALRNARVDGKHVVVILTKSRAGLPNMIQINDAFENFVIYSMQNQTNLFIVCLDNCDINDDDFRGSADRLHLLINDNSFTNVCDTVLNK